MPKITRVSQKLFASTASATKVGKFGSLAAGAPVYTSDPVQIQALAAFNQGWEGAAVGGNSPAIEDMNALFLLAFRQLGYLMQTGVAEYDSGTTYYIGSLVNDGNGNLYRSLIDNNTSALNVAASWVGVSFGGTGFITSTTTLNSNASTEQYVNAAGGNIYVTLPSTGVSKGRRFRFVIVNGTVSNGLTLISSNSSLIDTVNGFGFLEVMANIDTPVAGTDWTVVNVQETITIQQIWNGGSTNSSAQAMTLARINKIVTCTLYSAFANGPATGSTNVTSTIGLPSRFSPPNINQYYTCPVFVNGTGQFIGMLTMGHASGATIAISKDVNGGGFSSTGSGNGIVNPFTFTYQLL